MGPELEIQNRVSDMLLRDRWIVLRVGFNGLPDLIALKPDGEGSAWLRGFHRRPGCFPIKWKCSGDKSSKLFRNGLTLTNVDNYKKLCLELKAPGVGDKNARQKAIIKQLSDYSISMFVDNVKQVQGLTNTIPR